MDNHQTHRQHCKLYGIGVYSKWWLRIYHFHHGPLNGTPLHQPATHPKNAKALQTLVWRTDPMHRVFRRRRRQPRCDRPSLRSSSHWTLGLRKKVARNQQFVPRVSFSISDRIGQCGDDVRCDCCTIGIAHSRRNVYHTVSKRAEMTIRILSVRGEARSHCVCALSGWPRHPACAVY